MLFWAPSGPRDHDDTAPTLQSQNSHPCICKQALLSVKGLKKSEIRPFVATGTDLEVFILSELSQTERQILYAITYALNLINNDTDELIYKTDAQM